MDWSEETIVRLRGFWSDGHSTAEIGRRLGVTKNAVVGKAHRLDLPARPSPIRRDGMPGAQARRPAPLRMAGPTLPPLSSISPACAQAPQEAASAASISASTGVMPPRVQPYRTEPSGPVRSQAAPRPVDMPRPAPHAVAVPARPQPVARPYARSLTCCWPIGEPGTKSFRFCDDGAAQGKPYCAQHAAIAYVRVRDRREDVA